MGAAQIEFEIKKQIYCELRRAVWAAQQYPFTDEAGHTRPMIPTTWGALISLSLEVDESSALNPGVALNTPRPTAITSFPGLAAVTTPQMFSLGFGGTLSSTATRIDKYDPYYSIADLQQPIDPNGTSVCNTNRPKNDPFVRIGFTPAKSSPLIESDLRIKEWLVGAMWANQAIESDVSEPKPKSLPSAAKLESEKSQLRKKGYTEDQITQIQNAEITQILASKASSQAAGGGGQSKPDTVSIEIKFVIVTSGNVTPTWKLVRVSANTGSTPFFGLGRIRTHDVIITIGPPTQPTLNTHLASQVGQSVSSANRAFLATPGINNAFTFPTFP